MSSSRPKIEAEHHAKFLVVDMATGGYEIDEDDQAARKQMLAERPELALCGLRIGHPIACRPGGTGARWPQRSGEGFRNGD